MRALFRWMLGAVLWLCIAPFGWAQGLITHLDSGTDLVKANGWVHRMMLDFGEPVGGPEYFQPRVITLPGGCPGVGTIIEFDWDFSITCNPATGLTEDHMDATGQEIVSCTPITVRAFDLHWHWSSTYDVGVDYVALLQGWAVAPELTLVEDPNPNAGAPDEPGGGSGGSGGDTGGGEPTGGTWEHPLFFMSVHECAPEGRWRIGFRIEGVAYWELISSLPPALKAKAEAWTGARCEFYGH